MVILLTGSHGFIATSIIPSLTRKGHRIVPLVRTRSGDHAEERIWDPYSGYLDPATLEGIDAVIHLSGENIAEGRWTADKKRRILQSRTTLTRVLATAIAASGHPPGVFVSASAIGYYGDRGEEILTEESAPGSDFLSKVCQEWEATSGPAAQKTRVVNLRFGLILSGEGGALPKIAMPFRFGAGGVLGSGRQFWSWIAIDDVAGAIEHVLLNQQLQGPVNFVTPQAVTNKSFSLTLGRVLSRPAILPAPALALRIMLGEMADALLLSSARVEPRKLDATNYPFRFTDLETCLRELLRKSK